MYLALGLPGRMPLLYLLGWVDEAGGITASGFVVRYPIPRARTLRVMTKTKTGWEVQRRAKKYSVPRLPTPGHFLTQQIKIPYKEKR